MKKILSVLLTLALLLSAMALAEQVPAAQTLGEGSLLDQVSGDGEEAPAYDHLTVGNPNPMDGFFFTDMWGNVTADIDVRMLLHGYNLMTWIPRDATFGINESVVTGVVVTDSASTGNRTWQLVLADDLQFSDGTKITAYDYAFSMLLSMSPVVAQLGGATVDKDYIVGAEAYKNGEAETVSGIRVLSDSSLSVTIDGSYLPFFYEVALLDCVPYPISVIAPGCAVADDGDGAYITGDAFTAETLRETIFGADGYMSHPSVVSGPYTLMSYADGVAEFEINPYYKGNADGTLPVIPYITYKNVSNAEGIEALRNGDIDLLHKCVSAATIDAGMELVAEGAAYSAANYPRAGFSFISYSCEKATVAETAVRQAIAMCFDKEALVADYVSNYGLAVDGYYGLGQWMYQLVTGSMAPPVEPIAADASEEDAAAYDAAVEAYEALSIDDIAAYALDLDAAAALLDEAGWNLNEAGEAFDPEKDAVRCKDFEGEMVPLKLTLRCYTDAPVDGLKTTLAENLAKVGIELTIIPTAGNDLLNIYYRNVERDCDMIYMATNFATVFDPAVTFNPADAYQGVNNRTGIADEKLYNAAVAMRTTEPGDVLTYTQHWVEFETRFAEVLPVIPVYSNVYFDFYAGTLHDYAITDDTTWAEAIVPAYLGDVTTELEEEESELIGIVEETEETEEITIEG